MQGSVPFTTRVNRLRRLSLGTKLAAGTVLVLAATSSVLFEQLTRREREGIIASKEMAATMVANLLSADLAVAYDFHDAEEVAAGLERLKKNKEVVDAAAWGWKDTTPTALWTRGGTMDTTPPQEDQIGKSRLLSDRLDITGVIVDRGQNRIAKFRVGFSLARENEAYRDNRKRLLTFSLLLAAGTATALVFIARSQIILPIRRLVEAARQLEKGTLIAPLTIHSHDEIGELAQAFNTMGAAVAFRQEQLQEEMKLAQQIQTALLPNKIEANGLEIAANMVPSSEVGGDYYDVFPTREGCWVGIGDVTGHGLNSGIISLMIQSVVAGFVHKGEGATPATVIRAVDSVLYHNVHGRLERNEHASLVVLFIHTDGRVVFSGAHESMIVYRAAEGRCEIIETPGTWVGIDPSLEDTIVESTYVLGPDDILVLYTDGAPEAMNHSKKLLGINPLARTLEEGHNLSATEICDSLFRVVNSWMAEQYDDITLMVIRRREGSYQVGGGVKSAGGLKAT